jgi:proline racemase
MLDRSPCGTGTCAVMACLHREGKLSLGSPFVHESIVGTQFIGQLVGETMVLAAVCVLTSMSIPCVTIIIITANKTEQSQYVIFI